MLYTAQTPSMHCSYRNTQQRSQQLSCFASAGFHVGVIYKVTDARERRTGFNAVPLVLKDAFILSAPAGNTGNTDLMEIRLRIWYKRK